MGNKTIKKWSKGYRRSKKQGGDKTKKNSTLILDKEIQQTNFLKKLCPHSEYCITLGKYTTIIKDYFNDYKTNINTIRLMSNPSTNGFLNEIVYEKNDYTAHCILKSSLKNKSDNLYYEYYIGRHFINNFVTKFPCFVETYHLCFYKNNKYYNMFKRPKLITNIEQLDGVNFTFVPHHLTDDYMQMSCDEPTHIAILIQHINNPISLHEFIKTHKNTEYGFNVDMLQIFLQIYIPLGRLAHGFTHNDLHPSNVLLYTIPNNQYITLTYDMGTTQPITIKTRYIAKMIDYGRSYFDNGVVSSLDFYNKVPCKDIKYRIGYNWFERPTDNDYYISQLTANISKDLWLIGIYCTSADKYMNENLPITQDIQTLLDQIDPGDKDNNYRSIPSQEVCNPPNICNVQTLSMQLCTLYTKHIDYINEQYATAFDNWQCIGELIIDVNELTDSIFKPTIQ